MFKFQFLKVLDKLSSCRYHIKSNLLCLRSENMRKALLFYCFLLVGCWIIIIQGGCSSSPDALSEETSTYAVRIAHPEVPNFARVTKNLYRGGQPTPEGFQHLKNIGVKTVVNLRAYHRDVSGIRNIGLHYVELPMTAFHGPTRSQMKKFFWVLKHKPKPVFIHCHHGSDRTGVMLALYRVVVQGWEKEKAIREMEYFGNHWIHEGLQNVIRNLEVDGFRRDVGYTSNSYGHGD